jgi:mannosyl-glycoprotein endo-beta-N-acetylglucosaminidase
MKKRLLVCLGIVLAFGFPGTTPVHSVSAYNDLSKYKIETQEFVGENEVNRSLEKLKKDTGWAASPVKTGEDSYQLYSGGFGSESYTKDILADFEKDTGIQGDYEPVNSISYYEIYSGGFGSKSRAATIASQFQQKTGVKGTVEPVGEKSTAYYQIYSGGFGSESYVKDVLDKFKLNTGIDGTYEPVGVGTPFYQVRSGGFTPESRAKSVADELTKETGIKAAVEPIGSAITSYTIRTGGFRGVERVQSIIQEVEEKTGQLGSYEPVPNSDSLRVVFTDLSESEFTAVKNYISAKNWWFSSSTQKVYGSYRVITVPVKGATLAKKGHEFFTENNWWSTYTSTGEYAYSSYRVVSEPVEGVTIANKGREFFNKNNWWASYTPTGDYTYSSYRVVSEPVLGQNQADKALSYFTENNWWAKYTDTGVSEATSYRIVSAPVSERDLIKGLDYFKDNNWWVSYKTHSKSTYLIRTANFTGIDVVNAGVQRLKDLYGWDSKVIKTYNGPQLMTTNYDITLNEMLNKQMETSPQTDKYRNEPRFVHSNFVDINEQTIVGNNVNVRTSMSTASDSNIVQQLNNGDNILVIGRTGDWVEIRITWQNAKSADVKSYLDTNNFSIDNKEYFQFLKLSQPAGLNANEINDKVLKGKGVLDGEGQAFIDAANKYGINEVYLISHSLLETGNGTSTLAKGVEYNGKTVYNMYGYGAYDSCPLECGVKKAYELGWFTPEEAIIGGAQYISSGYIYNSTFKQDTLYKMRWNPVQTWHQYATDIGWAHKQVGNIYSLYQLLDDYTLYYDVSVYQ